MQNPTASSSNLNSRFVRWLRLTQPMFLVATISLVLLACQISSLPVVPNIPFLGPTPTPPSAQSVLSRAMAISLDAKSLRVKMTQDYQGSSPTSEATYEFVAPDKMHMVIPRSSDCKNNETREIIVIGQSAYLRCGTGGWSRFQEQHYTPPPTTWAAGLARITGSGFMWQCATSGSVTYTKLGSDDVWSVLSDCPAATATWLIDPSNYQPRQVKFEDNSGTFTFEFSNYDDPSITINAPLQ